ncbi:hypothetical protein PVAP13_1KG354300 [Panicum virgatum]|uniref:SMP domain-containing protein n=1 Tax=Panicum virgatum TaxID=38727 RepID=A0A8T0XJ16_PANVG|nr:hypothetical protein PVAP13_1KG354300 [Panicum virgatum]
MSRAQPGRPGDDGACREQEEPVATEKVTAAEKSAPGLSRAVPGGVAAAARRAAAANEHGAAVAVRDVLGGAAPGTPGDRAATWVDAEKVAAATGRGGGGMGEVADALAAAAQINEGSTLPVAD